MDMLDASIDASGSWAGPAGRMVFLAALFLPVIVLGLAIALADRRPAPRVRRFWCRGAGREVEVLFVEREVRACSAFEPARAITCRRACLDGAYRRQWEPALPVFSRRTREAA
ncbi:MAG: hypothetical protein HYR86_10815 [Candidatus Rokubacteria bacterium]|nr:hypothetical protein [Candidatus Rokubacteria bacterium]